MGEIISGLTRGGTVWTPEFVVTLKQENCIGCGRCYKVCPRQVLDLVEREVEDDEEDEFSDDTAMVMSIANAMDCIGCKACSKVCPKNCYTHAPAVLHA